MLGVVVCVPQDSYIGGPGLSNAIQGTIITKTFQGFSKFMESYMHNHIDFIISLGADCKPAYHLKRNNLRIVANPFDWMMCYTLTNVIDIINTRFKTFFIDIHEDTTRKTRNGCRYIIDKKNNFVSMHHFKKNLDVASQYDAFYDKMKFRFYRMLEYINNSENVMFICNRNEDISNFVKFLKSISEIFDKKYLFINTRHHDDKSAIAKRTYNISKKIDIIEYFFYDVHKKGSAGHSDYWMGNLDNWGIILNEYKLSTLFSIQDPQSEAGSCHMD